MLLQFKSFLTIFVFVFCCATVAFSQECPPKPDVTKEGVCQDENITSTIVSPLSKEFPDCKLSVIYKFQQCTKLVTLPSSEKVAVTTFRIFDYEIDVNSSSFGCLELLEKLGDPSLAGQEFLRRFNVSIGRQLQDDVANIFITDSGSLSTFDCNNSTAQKIVNVDYYEAGCISFVKGEIKIDGKPKTLARQVPCESAACCGFSRTYCYDAVAKKLKFVEKELPLISPVCKGELPLIPGIFKKLKATNITQGPCIALCGAFTPTQGSADIFKSAIAGKSFQMKVYPNPSNDYINVYFDKEMKGSVELYNLEGKLIRANDTEIGSTYFDISLLPKGSYVVKFTTADGEVMAEKIAIQ